MLWSFSEQIELDPSLDKELNREIPLQVAGTHVIDYIDTCGIPHENIIRSGQLPHGIGFNSDHQCIYADIDVELTIGLAVEKCKVREQRRLKIKNLVTSEVYNIYLKVSIQAHNVWDRVQRLWELAKD